MSPRGGPNDWTLEDVTARLGGLAIDLVPPDRTEFGGLAPDFVAPARTEVGALHRSAAMRASFTLTDLGLDQGDGVAPEVAQLLDDSVIVYEGDDPRLALRPEVRRVALKSFVSREEIAAETAKLPDQTSVLDRMLAAYVRGDAKPLGNQSLDELRATSQAIDWLDGTDAAAGPLPERADVQRLSEWGYLLKPFQDLAGTNFFGRKEQLSRLRAFVGALEAQSLGERLTRSFRAFFAITDRPPLLIHALGGMGKSSLVGRFILDHVDTPDPPVVPLLFAYLDFDSPRLAPERPGTIVAEMFHQLALQLPELRRAAATLSRLCLEERAEGYGAGQPDPAWTRKWLADMVALTLDDPANSGALADLVDPGGPSYVEVASANPSILPEVVEPLQQLILVDLQSQRSPEDVQRTIVAAVGADAAAIPSAEQTTQERQFHAFAEYLIASDNKTSKRSLILFQGAETVRPDVESLIRTLRAAAELGRGGPRIGRLTETLAAHPATDPGPLSRPLLLVLDTFEEVQYRTEAVVRDVVALLDLLQRRIPLLRLVVSGRTGIALPGIKCEMLELGGLDAEAAQALLEHRKVEPELAARVVAQVGGNPLTLKLAGDLLKRGDEAGGNGVAGLKTRDILARRLPEVEIQGQLYRRLLGHVHVGRIGKLINPGMVLRRITPDIIRQLLAVPCGVDVPDDDTAKALFEELSREVTLVIPAEAGVVRHQPELRRVMLGWMRRDDPAGTKAIHEAAVRYYSVPDDPGSRAELAYHLLMLERDGTEIEKIWRPGMEKDLAGALDELPGPSRVFLAGKLGVSIDKSLLQQGRLEDRATLARREMSAQLQRGDAEEALKILSSVPPPAVGPRARTLQAAALLQLGRTGDARTALTLGLEKVDDRDDPAISLRLALLDARLDVLAGIATAGGDLIDQLDRMLALVAPTEPLLIRLGLLRLDLLERRGGEGWWAERVGDWIGARVAAVLDSAFNLLPGLLLEAVGRIGARRPETVARLLDCLPLRPSRTNDQVGTLIDALTAWNDSDTPERERGWLLRHLDLPPTASPGEAQGLIAGVFFSNTELLYRTLLYLKSQPEGLPPAMTAALAAYFRAAAEPQTDVALFVEMETIWNRGSLAS